MDGNKVKKVLAILCSDLHLSHTPPSIRTATPDWYEVMEHYLCQLRDLQTKYDCPVICAGDLFDNWHSPPELINFAIDHLPSKMFCVPGQHDLPNHSYSEMHRSAYWTLVKAKRIVNLHPSTPVEAGNNLTLHGFPWGEELYDLKKDDNRIHIAVIHKYIYKNKRTAFYGVNKNSHVNKIKSQLKGYDAAVFGDNHISWIES